MGQVNDQMGDQQPRSPQDRYYERYLQDTDPTLRGSGGGRGRRNALIAGGVAAVLLVGGGGVFLATRGGGTVDDVGAASTTSAANPSTSAGSQGPSSTTTSSSTSSSSSSSSSSVDPQATRAAVYGPAVKPGWRIVEGKKDTSKAAYDIPADEKKWSPPSRSDTLLGWTRENKEDKSVLTSAPSTYLKGSCATYKSGNAGFVGFVNIGSRDPSEVAPDVVERTSKLIRYNKTTKQYAKASSIRTRQITVNGGKTPAIESLMTFENGDVDAKKCEGKNYEARTIAFSGNGVSTMLLIYRNMDHAQKMPDQDVLDIINSLRPMK